MSIELNEGNLNGVFIAKESVISSQKTGVNSGTLDGLEVAAPGNQTKI